MKSILKLFNTKKKRQEEIIESRRKDFVDTIENVAPENLRRYWHVDFKEEWVESYNISKGRAKLYREQKQLVDEVNEILKVLYDEFSIKYQDRLDLLLEEKLNKIDE